MAKRHQRYIKANRTLSCADGNCGTGEGGFTPKNKCGGGKGDGTPKNVRKPEVTGKGRGGYSKQRNESAQREGFQDAEDKARFENAIARAEGKTAYTELELKEKGQRFQDEMKKESKRKQLEDSGRETADAIKAKLNEVKTKVDDSVKKLKARKMKLNEFIASIVDTVQGVLAEHKKKLGNAKDIAKTKIQATPQATAAALVSTGLMSVGAAKYIWMSGRD